MPKHIHKRFVRSERPPGPLRIQPRDVALLQDLASYRYLNTEQILALHPGGLRNTQKRLRYLYHLGYLDRPPEQATAKLPTYHIIYGLGEKAAELIGGAEERAVKTRLAAKEVSPNIPHALMISQFRIVLSLALARTGKILRWSQGYELRDLLKIKGQAPSLVPDAFFVLETQEGQWFFFLEADRSTMPSHRVLEKLKTYWEWYRNKTYEKIFDMPYFRVLTITENNGRRDNLCHTAKEADTKRTGSNLFIFACEKDYSLKKPEAVLSPIWLSAKDGLPHKMLE
jgi:hypothetical protein